MGLELSDSWSFISILVKHFEDEVFEISGERLSSNLLPVLLKLVVNNKVVEVLILLCLLEWEDALDNDKEDDTGGEDIDLSSIVHFSFFDFWGHIGHGTSIGLELIDLFVSSKSKVSYLKIKVVINKDVFELEISVDYVLALHIAKDVDHLVEEESSTIFTHTPTSLAKVE